MLAQGEAEAARIQLARVEELQSALTAERARGEQLARALALAFALPAG
jgi:hypothetical protein